MAYLGPVARWDIYWADLNEVVGREQAGSRRPVVIVSNDALNRSPLQLIAAIPLTRLEGKSRKFLPSEIPLPSGTIEPGVTPAQSRTRSAPSRSCACSRPRAGLRVKPSGS